MAHSTDLRQQIEDLALQLVVADPGSGTDASVWANALQKIHGRAMEEQASQLAGATAALMQSLSLAEQTGSVTPAELLQNGIVGLQQILEGEITPPVRQRHHL